MRVCLQRVREAAVTTAADAEPDVEVARIGAGVVALVGFAAGDLPEELAAMAVKLADLRLFPGPGGEFDRSLRETGDELLVVSQFTLYGDTRKGRRPDFTAAAPYGHAEKLYQYFCEFCEAELSGRVASGVFGAEMRVMLVNDGPVTLWLER